MKITIRECTCAICGKEFLARSNRAKYCSVQCSNSLQAEKMRRRYVPAKPSTGICPVCGVEFDKRHRSRIYCSRACQKKNEHMDRITYDRVPKPIVDRTQEVLDIDKKAKEAGMSYGKYVAMQQMIKEREMRRR